MADYKASAARDARTRLARRARRSRLWKEYRNRVYLVLLVVFIAVVTALFAPWGPNWYHARIEKAMIDPAFPNTVREGTIRDLYKLGSFYSHTFRDNEARRTFDEIGKLHFGIGLSNYAMDPEGSFETRRQATIRMNKGEPGPPYRIAASDVQYVGKAIYDVGQIMEKNMSRLLIARLYYDLYIDDLLVNHPEDCDPETTRLVEGFAQRISPRSK